MLQENRNRDELVSIMLDNYDIDKGTAARDIDIFLDKLRKQNMLVE